MNEPCDEMKQMTETWLDALGRRDPKSEDLREAAAEHAINCAECEAAFMQPKKRIVVMEIVITGKLDSA